MTQKSSQQPSDLLDLIPLIVFLMVRYFTKNEQLSALLYVGVAVLVFAVQWLAWGYKSLSFMAKLNLGISIVFGGFTYFMNDPSYIQIKFTVLAIVKGCVWLFARVYRPTLFIQLSEQMQLYSQKGQNALFTTMAITSFVYALVNEVLRRTLSFETWFALKFLFIFPMMGVMVYVLIKHADFKQVNKQ